MEWKCFEEIFKIPINYKSFGENLSRDEPKQFIIQFNYLLFSIQFIIFYPRYFIFDLRKTKFMQK